MPAAQDSSQAPSTTLREWYVNNYNFFSMPDSVFTFETEFVVPEGYECPDSTQLTPYQNWVSHFPLWHRWKPVGIWKGGKAYEREEVARVVHLPWKGPVFKDCAIPLRILAEYFVTSKREFDLHVLPAQGDALRYEDWLKGQPRYTARSEVFLQPSEQRDTSLAEYFQFLDLCMKNTTCRSLAANCDSIPDSALAPGDLFIAHDEQGRIGCAYVALRMLVNSAGEKLYAIATGCREACDFHIPLFNNDRSNPWVTAARIRSLGAEYPHAGFFRLPAVAETQAKID